MTPSQSGQQPTNDNIGDSHGMIEDRLSPDGVRQVKPPPKKRRGVVRMVDDFEHERSVHPEWATTDWVD